MNAFCEKNSFGAKKVVFFDEIWNENSSETVKVRVDLEKVRVNSQTNERFLCKNVKVRVSQGRSISAMNMFGKRSERKAANQNEKEESEDIEGTGSSVKVGKNCAFRIIEKREREGNREKNQIHIKKS